MEKEHYGFCSFCGSELSGWTEEHSDGVNHFLKCEGCQKLWVFKFDKDGKMIEADREDGFEEV